MKENLFLFAALFFKVGLYCGFWPGLVIAIAAERFRVVEIGIEKVSAVQVRGGQLARLSDLGAFTSSNAATSLPRKVKAA